MTQHSLHCAVKAADSLHLLLSVRLTWAGLESALELLDMDCHAEQALWQKFRKLQICQRPEEANFVLRIIQSNISSLLDVNQKM